MAAFPGYPERGPNSIVLFPVVTETFFTMSRELYVMQIEEDVLKFIVAGILWSGTNLDFQMEPFAYKRKNEGVST